MGNNNGTSLIIFVCVIVLALVLVFFKTEKTEQVINNNPINTSPPTIINQPPVIVNPTPQPVVPPPQPPVDYSVEQKRFYSLGYEDGCNGRPRNLNFSNSVHYESGYRDGSRHWKPELRFNFNFK